MHTVVNIIIHILYVATYLLTVIDYCIYSSYYLCMQKYAVCNYLYVSQVNYGENKQTSLVPFYSVKFLYFHPF